MKSNLFSKSLMALSIGLLSLSAMAEGTPAMVSIASQVINSQAAANFFTGYQSRVLQELIAANGSSNFDLSAIYCGRFMVRRGLGKFSSSRTQPANSGLYLDVRASDITVLNSQNRRQTVVSLRGFCSADSSSELQAYTVQILMDLEAGKGNIMEGTLQMNAESGI